MGHPNQKKITLILPLCKLFKSVAKTGEIGENAVTIPLSFQPGLYFYIVKNNNALFQGKFIVN